MDKKGNVIRDINRGTRPLADSPLSQDNDLSIQQYVNIILHSNHEAEQRHLIQDACVWI